ncbi:MAG: hypothetical protein H6813_03370 [Phycisphaeraceae bacterium]|nr:hypothetical protein [Phycisphaeraceae bacterium]MCB9846986.1 hypothetical protein [Phycisphaeraceae bacterium]
MTSPISLITIDADERHDPPRWVRFAGSRAYELWDDFGIKTGLLIAVVILVPYFILWSYFQEWVESLPWWSIYIAGMPLVFVLGLALMLRLRWLRRVDLQSIETNPRPTPHQRAIADTFLSGSRWRPLGMDRVNARAYFDAYRAQDATPPPIVLQGIPFIELNDLDIETPLRIVPDPPLQIGNARWIGWFYLVMAIFCLIALLALLDPSTRSGVGWQIIIFPAFWLAPSLMFVDMCYCYRRRHTVTCFPGGIKYRKRFKQRTIMQGEAICFANKSARLAVLEWHRPDHAFPEFVMHFRDPEDPRLQTILNCWTADPLPGPAA